MILMFGKNLKKIRSVHGLSQQEFADIFDLKRGTLGAYEEGRSNPKLETVIRIANHFSTGIEELLIGELTVNRLLKFNERITTESDKIETRAFEAIPCILANDKINFAKNYKVDFNFSKFSALHLPYIESRDRIAFSVDDLSMTGGVREFFPKDIVIGFESNKISIPEKSLIIAIVNEDVLLRKLYFDGQNYTLKADHHGVEDVAVSNEELKYIWKVEHVFQYNISAKEIILENRLTNIEQNLASLKNEKTT